MSTSGKSTSGKSGKVAGKGAGKGAGQAAGDDGR